MSEQERLTNILNSKIKHSWDYHSFGAEEIEKEKKLKSGELKQFKISGEVIVTEDITEIIEAETQEEAREMFLDMYSEQEPEINVIEELSVK